MSEVKVPVGYKSTEVGVIPEDWEVVSLNDVASFGGGTTPPRMLYERYYARGIYPWVKTLDLNNSFIWNTEEYLTELTYTEISLKRHPIGTVLVAMYGGFNQIGRTGLLKIEASMNQALVAVIPKKEKLVSEYLLYNLNFNVDYWKEVASSSRKDPNITSNDIKNYLLAIPFKPEQTAIATALSDVDNLIQSLEKLIAKKEAIKTGTMQQLLTGKTRLPEFATRDDGSPKGFKQTELGRIPEDWKMFKFNEHFVIFAGGDAPRDSLSKIKTESNPYPIFANAIQNKGLYGYTSYKRAKPDSITITARGYLGHAEYRDEYFFPIVRLLVLEPIGSLNPKYTTFAINSLVEFSIESTGVPQLTAPQVGKYSVIAPMDKNEQAAIATILADMDTEIQALQQRLEKTKDIKQGMMQQLLTGKVRLAH